MTELENLSFAAPRKQWALSGRMGVIEGERRQNHRRHDFTPTSLALIKEAAPAGVAQWICTSLQTEGSPVRFPVRAHAWVVGQVPCRGYMRGNHTLMFLSLSFSLPSPLSTKEMVEKRECSHTAGRAVGWGSPMGNLWQTFSVPCDPAIPLLGTRPRVPTTCVPHRCRRLRLYGCIGMKMSREGKSRETER